MLGLRRLPYQIVTLAAVFGVVAAVALPASAQTKQELIRAAEKEGKVTVISPPVQSHRQTIELFRQAYPKIDLEISAMTPDQFEPRIDSERKAAKYLWDVVISGVSTTVYTRQIPAGWYAPIRDLMGEDLKKIDLWIGGFDSGFLDNDRKYVFAFAGSKSESIAIDRSQIPEAELSKPEDLLNPKFKGKIAWLDPRERGSGSLLVAQLMLILGEEKLRKLLAEQEIVLTSTPRQIAEWAARGRFPITIGAPQNEIIELQKLGIGKDTKPLALPPKYTAVSPQWGAVTYVDKAPHPNAARLFIDWLLSREAQADWAQRGRVNSRRADVSPGAPDYTVSGDEWREGLNLNAETTASFRLKAMQIAKEVLR